MRWLFATHKTVFSALRTYVVWASKIGGSRRFSDTKADGNVGFGGFSGTIDSARSSNECKEGEIWTIKHWLARLAMVLVAVEQIGGLFFYPWARHVGTRPGTPGLAL